MVVTCERGEMRASADGLFIYDANGKREIALPKSAAMPGRSEVLDDMIAAIRTGKPPLQDGRWGKANVEVTLAMLQSARERREVMLEHQVALLTGIGRQGSIFYISHEPLERPAMNYQPSGHDFVVENPDAKTFFVNREVFVSDDVFEREKRAIFDRCWVYVGHASEIKNPGDFKTRPVAGRPIIFCRDREGTVRALINCCRHRGALVCREREGNARQFYCMYHGWTYHPDGRLKSVPGEDAYGEAFDKSEMGLVPVPRLEAYRDFYFANFDREAIDLDSYLGKAKDYIDLVIDQSPSGKMQIISGTQEYDIRANWKLLVENSVDDYHLISTHSTWLNYMRNSGVNVTPPKGELLPTRGFGTRSGQRPSDHRQSELSRPAGGEVDFGLWRGRQGRHRCACATSWWRGSARRAPRASPTPTAICAIFPNLVINDGSSVTVRHFYPVAPDRMHVTAWALGPVEETEAQRARRLHAFLTFYGPGGFATPDDVAALEAAQLGFAAWREVPWSDLSRGMAKAGDQQLATDEGHLRVFWRKWNELMETRA